MQLYQKSKKVDIIIPCFNKLKYTKKCVESIRRFTNPSLYNFIFIDNGSADGTEGFLNGIDGKYVIANEENLGWERALNQGLQVSETPFVLFMNNDIEVTEGWLDKMLHYFEDPLTVAVGPKSNAVMGVQSIEYKKEVDHAKHLIGFCLLVKRRALDEVKEDDYIDESGCSDDHDLSIRLRLAGYKLRVANNVFVFHHFSKTLMSVEPDYKRYSLERRRLLRKKWGVERVVDLFVESDTQSRQINPQVVFITDDVCPSNLGFFEYWHYVKYRHPDFKLLAFVVANYRGKENVAESEDFIDWYEETKDWVEIGVHGYDHLNPPEQERDDAEELVAKSVEILKPFLLSRFLYRPPGFQRTIHTEPMLKRLGFAGIAYQNRIRYFGRGIANNVFNTHCTGNHVDSITRWKEWF